MSIPDCASRRSLRQSGLSLIELVIFIVIVSVGIAGILSVMNLTTRESADPMLRKQALSIAESLMEEIQMQPFTFCDPDDEAVDTANGTGDCTAANTTEGLGKEGGEERLTAVPLDNVSDYHNYSVNPATNINGASIPGYAASVAIAQVGNGSLPLGDASAALQITVRVTGPAGTDISLTGYRTRYAPNTGP